MLAVLMILATSVLPAAAAAKPEKTAVSAIKTDKLLADDAAQRVGEDDFRVDLDLATTLIVSISAVLIILVFVFVIVMGNKNRPKPKPDGDSR